jgi:hypothetical protein
VCFTNPKDQKNVQYGVQAAQKACEEMNEQEFEG